MPHSSAYFMEKLLILLFTAIAGATSVSATRTHTPLLPASTQREADNGTIISGKALKRRITSILSPIVGDDLTTVDSLERAEAERGGVWVEKTAADDYESKFHRAAGDKSREEPPQGSILKRGFELMIRCRNGRSPLSSSSHKRGKFMTDKRDGHPSQEKDEHPMRTDEWLVQVKLSPLLSAGRKAREANLFPQSVLRYTNEVEEMKARGNASIPSAITGKLDQMMKFARNGYVMLMEDADQTNSQNYINNHDPPTENKDQIKTRITRIGKWKLDTAGISWDIPIKVSSTKYGSDQIMTRGNHQIHDGMPKLSSSDENLKQSKPSQPHTISKWTVLHYHADMHLSKFQQQPRMIRGTVTRDRLNEFSVPLFFGGTKKFILGKHLFRPVIGTFSAEGIGVDTIDFSYKNRGFGLNTAADPDIKKKKKSKM